ncbi:MAG: hypothetical protein R2856_31685 [Caldilineaceae bacterium]
MIAVEERLYEIAFARPIQGDGGQFGYKTDTFVAPIADVDVTAAVEADQQRIQREAGAEIDSGEGAGGVSSPSLSV